MSFLIAAGLMAASSYLGGKKEKEGIKGYSKRLAQLRKVAEDTQAKIDPFSQYRSDMAAQLAGIMGGTRDFKTDPGYEFRRDQELETTQRGMSARGLNISGSGMAAMQQRSQDIASQEFGRVIERLTQLSGATPQNAIAGGQAYGNIMTQMVTGQAEARMAGGQASAAQIGGMGQAIAGGMTGGMATAPPGGFGAAGGFGAPIVPQPQIGPGGGVQGAGAGTGFGGIFKVPGGFFK